jgi:hypothetical protein
VRSLPCGRREGDEAGDWGEVGASGARGARVRRSTADWQLLCACSSARLADALAMVARTPKPPLLLPPIPSQIVRRLTAVTRMDQHGFDSQLPFIWRRGNFDKDSLTNMLRQQAQQASPDRSRGKERPCDRLGRGGADDRNVPCESRQRGGADEGRAGRIATDARRAPAARRGGGSVAWNAARVGCFALTDPGQQRGQISAEALPTATPSPAASA